MNGTNTCFRLSSLLAAWIISGLCRYSMMIVALGFYLGVSLLCLVSPVSCSAALKGLLNSHKNEESTDLHISSNANADKPAQVSGSPGPSQLALPRENSPLSKISLPLSPPTKAFALPQPLPQRQVFPLLKVLAPPPPEAFALPRRPVRQRQVFSLPKVLVPPPPQAFALPRRPVPQRQVFSLPKVLVPPPPEAFALPRKPVPLRPIVSLPKVLVPPHPAAKFLQTHPLPVQSS